VPIVTRGFHGRRDSSTPLPPGQFLAHDFPVLSAGPTPQIPLDTWRLTLSGAGVERSWNWDELMDLPSEEPTVDIHCVTKWSKLATRWQGISVDTLLEGVETPTQYAMVHAYGGYSTNVPLEDLRNNRAWIVHIYEGKPLAPEHGGPARLLVPHLYFWKSAKWVNRIEFIDADRPGFWEGLGYNIYGDPWREQRYTGD
jgi:DMSO/TMAO reductase YedYZ molybdopterin-dependent catalytic subunit